MSTQEPTPNQEANAISDADLEGIAGGTQFKTKLDLAKEASRQRKVDEYRAQSGAGSSAPAAGSGDSISFSL